MIRTCFFLPFIKSRYAQFFILPLLELLAVLNFPYYINIGTSKLIDFVAFAIALSYPYFVTNCNGNNFTGNC